MPVQKIKSGRVNIPVDNFVGDNGVVFFDEADGLFRLGDGFTPGGITLSSGGEGGFILPTASTTVKGGVRVDGTTITIANGVITAQASLLIGPQGLKGDAGANGNDGAPGAAGLNGNDGAPGPVIAATASVLGGVIVGGGINVTQNGTISVSFAGLASENFVETRGFLTAVSFNDLTDKPNLEGSYSFSIAADDSTQFEISAGNLVQIIGAQGVTTTADADGQIIITGPDLTEYATESYVNAAVTSAASPINANGTLSLPVLTSEPNNPQAGQIALAHGTSWDPLNKNDGKPYMALYAGQGWIDIGGLTTTDVYSQILELR